MILSVQTSAQAEDIRIGGPSAAPGLPIQKRGGPSAPSPLQIEDEINRMTRGTGMISCSHQIDPCCHYQ